MRTLGYALLIWTLSMACQPKKTDSPTLGFEQIMVIEKNGINVEEPFLHVTKEGKVLLSWIEKDNFSAAFKFRRYDQGKWSEENTIAKGDNWFINWADYPQISAFSDGTLIAAFLEKNGEGKFAYEIKISLSQNGKEWSKPFTVHDDGTETEHGFVSFSPWGEHMLITWLDGRNTGAAHDHSSHGHHGQMNLRAALISSSGEKLQDWLLDDRVCDCCQTSSAIGPNGPLVVFRDRSEEEIRDTGLIKWENGQWSKTQAINMDLWKIASCPVNGPKIATKDKTVAVAWYTATKDQPEVKITFSKDGGEKFSTPIKLGLGQTIGRIGLTLWNEKEAFACWMEENKIYLRKVHDSGRMENPNMIAESSEKRSSGFPQISNDGEQIWLAWTDDSQEKKKIIVGKYQPK